MPIREFACSACGRTVEELVRMDDATAPSCPACGAPMTRVPSAPAPHRSGHGRNGAGTCCGRETRCDTPPCGDGGTCCR